MAMLVLGVLLFAGVHLVPSLAPGVRASAWERLGEGGYKGIFSLLLLGSFALMIMGWRNSTPVMLYGTPELLHRLAICLLVVAFWLMTASATPSRIRSAVRHPQLTGVALWGVSHLMLNGDSRALILFGGLASWSIVEIIAISRREGVWIKAEKPGWGAEITTLLVTAASVALFVYLHPWISGVPVRW
jgi:uncharacterized membrane protein